MRASESERANEPTFNSHQNNNTHAARRVSRCTTYKTRGLTKCTKHAGRAGFINTKFYLITILKERERDEPEQTKERQKKLVRTRSSQLMFFIRLPKLFARFCSFCVILLFLIQLNRLLMCAFIMILNAHKALPYQRFGFRKTGHKSNGTQTGAAAVRATVKE